MGMTSSETPYQDEVVSAFIKELRLRNRAAALIWMMQLSRSDNSQLSVLRILRTFLIEDCVGVEPLQLALSLNLSDGMEHNHDMDNVAGRIFDYIMLDSTKRFWETEEGREAERAYWKAHDDLLVHIQEGSYPPIPEYALDVHTAKGREAETPPFRYSGTREGRLSMCAEFERLGRLSP
jgi:hypothetical protein